MTKFCAVLLLTLTLLGSVFGCPVYAQESQNSQSSGLDVTNVYQINDASSLENGDIVRNGEDGIKRSISFNDNKMFGVYQQNPLIVFRNVDGTGYPVVRNGTTKVNVSDLNGPIKQGDLITSSVIAGKGQKATETGYVLGSAIESFDPTANPTQIIRKETALGKEVNIGQIEVAVRIELAEVDRPRSANRFIELVETAAFTAANSPEQFPKMLKYIGSVLILLATASFAYLVFARSAGSGIQAIGRNPLARRSIQIAMILNIIFSSIIILLGIVATFVLLRA